MLSYETYQKYLEIYYHTKKRRIKKKVFSVLKKKAGVMYKWLTYTDERKKRKERVIHMWDKLSREEKLKIVNARLEEVDIQIKELCDIREILEEEQLKLNLQ